MSRKGLNSGTGSGTNPCARAVACAAGRPPVIMPRATRASCRMARWPTWQLWRGLRTSFSFELYDAGDALRAVTCCSSDMISRVLFLLFSHLPEPLTGLRFVSVARSLMFESAIFPIFCGLFRSPYYCDALRHTAALQHAASFCGVLGCRKQVQPSMAVYTDG